MILGAIIESPIDDENKVKVRIPRLHKPSSAMDATPFENLPKASICTLAGARPLFKVGDLVYVGFESNNITSPIVLGYMYNGTSYLGALSDIFANNLTVDASATFSKDFKVDGKRVQTVYGSEYGDEIQGINLTKELVNLSTKNGELQTRLSTLEEAFKKFLEEQHEEYTLLQEFNDYLEVQVANGSIYVLGAQGQYYSSFPTEQVFKKWVATREHDNETNINRVLALVQKRKQDGYDMANIQAFDCSGLGMYFIQNLKGMYQTDLNANGMYSVLCYGNNGALTSSTPLDVGYWVFKKNSGDSRMGHVGYIVSVDSTSPTTYYVIESKGRDVGVVKTHFTLNNTNGWTHWGKYPQMFV